MNNDRCPWRRYINAYVLVKTFQVKLKSLILLQYLLLFSVFFFFFFVSRCIGYKARPCIVNLHYILYIHLYAKQLCPKVREMPCPFLMLDLNRAYSLNNFLYFKM